MAKRPAAAQTAMGPMVIAAIEQHLPAAQRVVDDALALRLQPFGLRLLVSVCRARVARDLLIRLSERKAPGVWAGMLCRKRYIDDKLAEALEAGVGQVVVLGAGLDTRGCRLAAPREVPVFEVDLAENIAFKTQRLRSICGESPANPVLVAIDFERDDLADRLAESGFRLDVPTMFIWEGVTQYLTEPAVRSTLAFLETTSSGSSLIFTFVRADFLDGTDLYGAESIHRDFVTRQRVWHFGLDPADVAPLLSKYGWGEREQVGGRGLRARYIEPTGRDLDVAEIERIVHAEKP